MLLVARAIVAGHRQGDPRKRNIRNGTNVRLATYSILVRIWSAFGSILVASNTRPLKMETDPKCVSLPQIKKRREFKITLAASFVADNSVGSYRYSAKNFRTANDETQARTDGCR